MHNCMQNDLAVLPEREEGTGKGAAGREVENGGASFWGQSAT